MCVGGGEHLGGWFGMDWGSFRNMFFSNLVVMSESFWNHFGIVLGSCWDHFGIIVGPFGNNFGIVLISVWDKFGIIWGYVLGTFILRGRGVPPSPPHCRRHKAGPTYQLCGAPAPPLTSVGRCRALGTASRKVRKTLKPLWYQLCGTGLRIPRYHVTGQGVTLCKSRARHPTQRRYGPGSCTMS